MGIFSGCLLTSDIDGTLEANGIVSPRAVEKKEFFIAEGGRFSLATGRAVSAVRGVLKKVGSVSPSVLLNGAVIYDFENEEVLWEATLPEDEIELMLEIYNSIPGIGIELHTAREAYHLRENKELRDHAYYEDFEPLYITPDEARGMKINKILYAPDDIELLKLLRDFAEASEHKSGFMNTTAQLGGRPRYYFEQFPAEASKSNGCCKLAELLGISPGGHFAIGDYYNDLDMILKSDIGCFTADAPEELQKTADFISGPARDGAVADFIDYLAENRR